MNDAIMEVLAEMRRVMCDGDADRGEIYLWADRIEAALSAAPVGAEWRPIETAPKDGTRVLVFCPEDAAGNKSTVCAAWHGHTANDGSPIWWTDGAWLEEHELSHWRPLPAAPQCGREGE